jgi:hypothetical protein
LTHCRCCGDDEDGGGVLQHGKAVDQETEDEQQQIQCFCIHTE